MKTLLSALTATALLALCNHATAADKTTSSIAFTNRSQPGKLEVSLSSGSLSIRGTGDAQINVTSTVKSNSTPRADGLRVLGASSGFSLTENSNVARLEYLGNSRSGAGKDDAAAEFEVTVPRGTSVVVSGQPGSGGKIEVTGVSGDVEIRAMTGEVVLNGLMGGALVETMNGDIQASFTEFSGKPVSFTSMRGRIEVRVPAGTKAGIRLRTYTGEILTDFDDKAMVSRTEQTGAEKAQTMVFTRKNDDGIVVSSDATAELRLREAAARNRADSDAQRALRVQVDEVARQSGEIAAQVVEVARSAAAAAKNGFIYKINSFPIPPMTGGKLVTGTLNGGGAEISLATMNGDVTLRKLAP